MAGRVAGPLRDDVRLLPKKAAEAARLPSPDSETIGQLAWRLLSAEMPVLIVGFPGRDPRTVAPLVALAESVGLAVIDRGSRLSFPSAHELNLSGAHAEFLKDADLVLALEVRDLVGALGSFLELTDQGRPAGGAHVVTIGSKPFAAVDRAVVADSLETITALATVVEEEDAAFSEPVFAEQRAARIKLIASAHPGARGAWSGQAHDEKNGETGRTDGKIVLSVAP